MKRFIILLIAFVLCSCNIEFEGSTNKIDGTPKNDGYNIRIYNCTKESVYCSLGEKGKPSDGYIKLGDYNIFESEKDVEYTLDIFIGKGTFIHDDTKGTMNEMTDHHSTTEFTTRDKYTVIFIYNDDVDIKSE